MWLVLLVRGELIPLKPVGPAISDAAWALENVSRAKQTLANTHCGLPLQRICPHPNACLSCDSFRTTAGFLPQDRDQLARTDQLIADATGGDRSRLVEINEPVRLNLVRIIDGLEILELPMPAELLGRAAAARHDRATRAVADAVRALDRGGGPVTFQAVARRSGVSRYWLYTQQPDLRQEIETLRHRAPTRPGRVPARQRTSEPSLRQNLKTLRVENQRLREENAALKQQLAIAYGRVRAPA